MKTKLCAYGVIERNGKYTVVKSHGSKKYNLIGGALNPRENALEALIRESKEEVNCRIRPQKLIFCDNYIVNNDKSKFKIFYSAKAPKKKLKKSHEISEIKNFNYKEIKKLEKNGKLKQGVFEAIKKYRKLNS